MGKYNALEVSNASGIKVLDRTVLILRALAENPKSLTELCAATALPRATAHRLTTALETHNLVTRSPNGKWSLGSMITTLAAESPDPLLDSATPVLAELVSTTGESAQLYRLSGTHRICVAAHEPPSGLHNTVPVGSRLPLTAGSAAKIFVAYGSPSLRESILPSAVYTDNDLQRIRTCGWAESIEEREPGLASVSSPIFARHDDETSEQLLAVLSLSGSIERFGHEPGNHYGTLLRDAALQISSTL